MVRYFKERNTKNTWNGECIQLIIKISYIFIIIVLILKNSYIHN